MNKRTALLLVKLAPMAVMAVLFFLPSPTASLASEPNLGRESSIGNPADFEPGFTCWGNDGLDHPMPSHVIARQGWGSWGMGGSDMVGLALEQLPESMGGEGVDHGIITYKFCVRS